MQIYSAIFTINKLNFNILELFDILQYNTQLHTAQYASENVLNYYVISLFQSVMQS